MEEAKLVIVTSYGSRAEAELAKGALENGGIEAMVKSDTVGRMREHMAWAGAGFQIMVREEDAAAARELLRPTTQRDEVPDAPAEDDRDSSPWRRFT
jgi:hypothetical protein